MHCLHACHLVHGHFKQAPGWLGKRPTNIHIYLIIESILCSGCSLVIFTWDTNTFTFILGVIALSVQLIKIHICCLDKMPSVLISWMDSAQGSCLGVDAAALEHYFSYLTHPGWCMQNVRDTYRLTSEWRKLESSYSVRDLKPSHV